MVDTQFVTDNMVFMFIPVEGDNLTERWEGNHTVVADREHFEITFGVTATYLAVHRVRIEWLPAP
jgi:hypothetical protein